MPSGGRWAYLVALLVAAIVACGCSPARRQAQVRASPAYAALAPDDRRAIEAGELRLGMDTNTVLLAWGKPGRVDVGETASGREVVWRYYGSTLEQRPYWEYVPTRYGTWTLDYRVAHVTRKYLRATVVFREERVINWRRFPPPPR
jgi:hypothetical protein